MLSPHTEARNVIGFMRWQRRALQPPSKIVAEAYNVSHGENSSPFAADVRCCWPVVLVAIYPDWLKPRLHCLDNSTAKGGTALLVVL